MKIGELIQSGDWKGEKHVPVIDAPASVKAGEAVCVKLCVGAEIAHPNTPEHFIACWTSTCTANWPWSPRAA